MDGHEGPVMFAEEAHVHLFGRFQLEHFAGPVGIATELGPDKRVRNATGKLEEVVSQQTVAVAVGTCLHLTEFLVANCQNSLGCVSDGTAGSVEDGRIVVEHLAILSQLLPALILQCHCFLVQLRQVNWLVDVLVVVGILFLVHRVTEYVESRRVRQTSHHFLKAHSKVFCADPRRTSRCCLAFLQCLEAQNIGKIAIRDPKTHKARNSNRIFKKEPVNNEIFEET